eukprot:scaffold20351_cov43-Cyclotella_meneghiniana.AAC.2
MRPELLKKRERVIKKNEEEAKKKKMKEVKVLQKKKKEAQQKIDRERRKQVYTQVKLSKKALRKHQMHKYKSKNAEAICYQNKEYKLRNADAIRRGNHEYKLRNADAIRRGNHEYKSRNADAIRHGNHEYYSKNADILRQKQHEYYSKNADDLCQKQHEYYLKNADDLRQKRIKNYQKSKGTWYQFSDFGKRNYSRPNQCKTKDAPSSYSNFINTSTINENSTPEEIRNALKGDETSCNRRDSIEKMMKEIQEKFIEINFVNGKPDIQRANICVICDELIIGLEPVNCYNSMTSRSKDEKQNPPKFAIANGFVIGHIPRTDLTYHDSNGEPQSLPEDFNPDRDLDDLICAAISPVRPYGYVHAYQGGSQKSIT